MLDVLINKPEEKEQSKGVIKMSDRADKPVKSLLKSITWRIVGTIDTMIISYILTGKLTVAISIGSVEVITKTVLYYFHERIWAHIHRLRVIKIHREEKKRNGFARIKQPA
jgi:uncharacterized membrane protein